MSKSFSYNVVITKSSKVADKLFFETSKSNDVFSRTRLSTIATGLTKAEIEDTLIVSPFSNNGFISLTDDFPGGGSPKFITLKMLESAELLEKFLVPSNAQDELVAQRFKQRLSYVKEIDLESIEILKTIRPRFYLSYGIGDDVSQWSGPFVIDLVDVNLSITSDGVREIELGFMPTIDTSKLFSNKQYFDLNISQQQNKFDSKGLGKYTDSSEKYSKFDLRSGPLANDGYKAELVGGFNVSIREVLRDYLIKKSSTTPKGNVLVLFGQDLDANPSGTAPFRLEFAKVNDEEVRTDFVDLYRDKLEGYGIAAFYPEQREAQEKEVKAARTATVERIKKTEQKRVKQISDAVKIILNNNQEYKDQLTIIINTGAVMNSLAGTGNPRFAEAEIAYNEAVKRKEEIEQNTELASKNNNKKRSLEDVMLKDISNVLFKKDGDNIDPVGSSDINARPEPANPDYASEKERANYLKYKTVSLGLMLTSEGFETPGGDILKNMAPLYTFFDKLKESTTGSFQPIIFEENNLRITSLLEKHGFIEDASKPVLFLGDKNLINNLFYSVGPSPKVGSAFNLPGGVGGQASVSGAIKSYKEDMEMNLFAKRGRTSSFNEQVDFGPYKDFEKRIQPESLVFMHNLRNSNVLELSFDSSPYKAALMNVTYEPMYKLLDQQAVSGNLSNKNVTFKSVDYLSQYIKNKVKRDDGGYSTQDVGEIIKSINENGVAIRMLKEDGFLASGTGAQNAASFVDFLLFKLNGTEFSDLVQKVPGDKVLDYEAETLRKIHSYMLSVNIKTLPFFNTHSFLGRHCLLVGAPNKVIGSTIGTDNGRTKVPPPAIFSKGYNIFRYRNVITATEAYSEFTLYLDGFGNDVGTSDNANLIDLINLENIEKITKDKAKGYSSFGELLSEVELPRGPKQ